MSRRILYKDVDLRCDPNNQPNDNTLRRCYRKMWLFTRTVYYSPQLAARVRTVTLQYTPDRFASCPARIVSEEDRRLALQCIQDHELGIRTAMRTKALPFSIGLGTLSPYIVLTMMLMHLPNVKGCWQKFWEDRLTSSHNPSHLVDMDGAREYRGSYFASTSTVFES